MVLFVLSTCIGQSAFAKDAGSIVAWWVFVPGEPGWIACGQLDIPSPNSGFIAIAVGWAHSLAIKKVCQYKLTGDLNDHCPLRC